jgi:hypothetical protein
MQNSQDQHRTRLVSVSGNMASPSANRTEVMHADSLSAVESALLLGSFLTLAASLASLAAL